MFIALDRHSFYFIYPGWSFYEGKEGKNITLPSYFPKSWSILNYIVKLSPPTQNTRTTPSDILNNFCP